MLSWPLKVAITRAIGSRHFEGWSRLHRCTRESTMHVEPVKTGYVMDVEATPSQSEARVGPAGPTLSELRRQLFLLLAKI
eukprot:5786998-Pleurochrysis_carterae.AAC.1